MSIDPSYSGSQPTTPYGHDDGPSTSWQNLAAADPYSVPDMNTPTPSKYPKYSSQPVSPAIQALRSPAPGPSGVSFSVAAPQRQASSSGNVLDDFLAKAKAEIQAGMQPPMADMKYIVDFDKHTKVPNSLGVMRQKGVSGVARDYGYRHQTLRDNLQPSS